MSDVLIGALLSGLVSIVVASIQHNKSVAVLTTRLDALKDQVEKHNSVIERTYALEAKMEILEKSVK